ncbi:MAG: hypothetical protein JRN00_02005 [Nitrososphaerota archaeon]|jgi:flagellin-like protein|nr:hypothetical protein [Nitrososphaerota archaeon]
MKTAYLMKRKHRGISPILATIILIVITVVAGVMLYGFVTGFFSSSATSMNANIETSLTIPSGSQYATWAVTVKNAGTVDIKNISVTLYSGSVALSKITYPATVPVAPGQEVTVTQLGSSVTPAGASNSVTNQGLNSTSIISGSSYNYIVTLNFANGAAKTITGAVTASSF